MNEALSQAVLEELLRLGVAEFCVCPGGRNAPLCILLQQNPHLKTYSWHDERSAAFFALGRSRASHRPVAIIVTSGTAVGELLPATMEAFYSGIPLILVTADRPRHLRHSGAPQVADQVKIFGKYTPLFIDVADAEPFDLSNWDRATPCHINICFTEPRSPDIYYPLSRPSLPLASKRPISPLSFQIFLQRIKNPLVIVSHLKEEAVLPVEQFLLNANTHVYLEGISLLRERKSLEHLACSHFDLQDFDSVIRIGGIPTHRVWRELEEAKLPVFSITETPFPGISHGEFLIANIADFFLHFKLDRSYGLRNEVREKNHLFNQAVEQFILEEPFSEPSIIRELSTIIPKDAHVFLGNSMPIRHWDLAADKTDRQIKVTATRGLNGIDGQLSCFFGLTDHLRSHWGIFGDLTALYDLAAPWILPQLDASDLKIVILNNGGGKIFAQKFKESEMQNRHQINFEGFAQLWQLSYFNWSEACHIHYPQQQKVLIEIRPDEVSTNRFWEKLMLFKKDLWQTIAR